MPKHPRGKLYDDDEGQLQLVVYVEGETIVMNFGKSIKWIGMDKHQAIEVANCILEKANKIKPNEAS
jgi:hypothetical protein